MPTLSSPDSSTPSRISVRALLFDLDGVILDSTNDAILRWRAFSARHNLVAQEVLSVAHGQRTIDTISSYVPSELVDDEVAWFDSLEGDQNMISALPGARSLLVSLPPESWCIVTSCPRDLAISRLIAQNIPVPRVLVSADDVSEGKPSPAPYLMGLSALGVKATDAVVFEDAPSGITSASSAHIPVVALLTTHSPHALSAPYYVNDLSCVTVASSLSGAIDLDLRLAL